MTAVSIREVGPRDGLQLIKTILSTKQKIEWCEKMADCGFQEAEIGSILPPSILPQFADTKALLDAVIKIPHFRSTVLVPNLIGAQKAMKYGAQKITFVISASEMHNQANVRRSIQQSLDEFQNLLKQRNEDGLDKKIDVSCVIAMAFGCNIQGHIPENDVIDLALKVAELGADEINIADTVGYANPRQVTKLFKNIQENIKNIPLAGHFHDTRGMGLVNMFAALEAGITRFDTALGGLGGCPFARGASGNIATEDAVYMLESIGVNTGISLEKLLKLREEFETWLPNETISGYLHSAGLPKTTAMH